MNTEKEPQSEQYRPIDGGRALLQLIDRLVDERDVDGISLVNEFLFSLIKASVIDYDIDFIELGEYAGMAMDALRRGDSAESIKSLEIRDLAQRPSER